MRYRLRTLLILLAILPPLLAGAWWKYSAWRIEQARRTLRHDTWIQTKRGWERTDWDWDSGDPPPEIRISYNSDGSGEP